MINNSIKTVTSTINYASINSFTQYVTVISSLPILNKEEELQLAYQVQQDSFSCAIEAAQKLILHNLRFVVFIARKYSNFGLDIADLVQEGNIGLMKAVKSFDPSKGLRLLTVAVYYIRSAIVDFIINNWKIVKIATTKAQRKLFFNLSKFKQYNSSLKHFNTDTIKFISEQLNVSVKDVKDMEHRLFSKDISIDASSDTTESTDISSDTSSYANKLLFKQDSLVINPLENIERNYDEEYLFSQVLISIESLDDRSKDIIKQRFFSETHQVTLKELSDKYNISIERVRQIEKSALKKLREFFEFGDERNLKTSIL